MTKRSSLKPIITYSKTNGISKTEIKDNTEIPRAAPLISSPVVPVPEIESFQFLRQFEKRNFYNPAIVQFNDGYLFLVRIGAQWVEKMVVGYLNSKFELQGELRTHSIKGHDLRFFVFGGGLFGIYAGRFRGGRIRLVVCKVEVDNNSIVRFYKHRKIGYIGNKKMEKNWMPFILNGDLHFIYMVEPHIILRYNWLSGNCDKIAESSFDRVKKWEEKYGKAFGSTNAIQISNDEYLTIFHSSLRKPDKRREKRLYYVGAYTFSTKPPYKILRFTDTPILGPSNVDKDNWIPPWFKWMTKKSKVVFPVNMVYQDGFFYISYGENDRRSKILKIKKSYFDRILT